MPTPLSDASREHDVQFTIVSHACMYVEHGDTRLIIDPWFLGSCYWRSWWNFPEPDKELIENLTPNAVYLTHLHWDHFHGPSLKRFSETTRFYVPLATTDRMVRDLNSLGFKNIVEIPHGKHEELGDGLQLWSYQFGPTLDSTAVITDGQTVLLDMNDCKSFGAPLGEITDKFPKVDFMFRSHSSASPLPYCIEDYERLAPSRTQEDYCEEFFRCALSIGARYAVPFASNHCFLHKETIHFNHIATTPDMVSQVFEERSAESDADSQCVIMPPGSSWSAKDGFSIRRFDYSERDEYVLFLADKYQATLNRQYEVEGRAKPSFRSFQKYFDKLFQDVPWWVRRLLDIRMEFKTHNPDGSECFWSVDFSQGEVSENATSSPCDFQIEVHAKVLNDCCRKRMFSAWTPSKRLKVRFAGDNPSKAGRFFMFMDLYEQDAFPLSKNLSHRSRSSRFRRWREVTEVLRLGFRHKVLRRPFSVRDLYPM